MNDDIEHNHPAFAVARISRTSGGNPNLFGSPLPVHEQTFELTIQEATEYEDPRTGDRRIYASHVKNLVTVRMSAAQFMGLITTMNIGDGVPCTLTRFANKSVEAMPPRLSDDEGMLHAAQAKHRGYADTVIRDVEAAITMCDTMLEGKSVKKADLRTLRASLNSAHRTVHGTMPFAMRMYVEALGKYKAHALAQVEAVVTGLIHRTGLATLQGKRVLIEDVHEDQPEVHQLETT